MLKKSASFVLASLRGSTYRSVRLATSLAAAALDGHFEHPASRLEGVKMVDQLPQPARAPAVGCKGQPRQVPQVRLVKFFRELPAQLEGAFG